MAIPQEDIMAYDFGTTDAQEIVITNTPNQRLARLLQDWQDVSYPELSAMLTWLKYLYTLHQANHWTSKGDPFYGDHLLFQRLYEGVLEEVDAVAEKAVGVGSELNVDLSRHNVAVCKVGACFESQQVIPTKNALAQKSLAAEQEFLTVLDCLSGSMKNLGLLSRGIDNLIAGIHDKHEGHVYLLKRRCVEDVAVPTTTAIVGP